MVKLFKAELTGTGRPVLLRGEVERGMLDKVRERGRRVGGRRQGGASNVQFCRWPWVPHASAPPVLQVDLEFYGSGGVNGHDSEEYKVKTEGPAVRLPPWAALAVPACHLV